jgi:rhodanese-related sulfurtransferase
MKKLLLISALLSTALFAEFKTIGVEELEKMQAKGVPVIDIRTPGEWKQTGIIKGAHKMMFFTPKGEADVANWFFDLGHLVKDKNEPFIIYCAHANRTKSLGKGLDQMGFTHVYELKGGIENGWIKAGKKTEKE